MTLDQVTAEYGARQRERQAQHQASVMWHTRDGIPVRDGSGVPAGVSLGPDGAPQQRSAVHRDVPPLGEA